MHPFGRNPIGGLLSCQSILNRHLPTTGRVSVVKCRVRNRSSLPPLYQQQDDGSGMESNGGKLDNTYRMVETPIEERDLFGFSRFRWLCDEKKHVQQRYRRFNVDALVKAAVRAAGNEASSCTKLVKAIEGHNNKVFILTLDNGQELVAKIPNPVAGPAFFTVAAEVATSHFLRSVLKIPAPKIHTFSPDARNSVQAEYIIGEMPKGVPVAALWDNWTRAQIVDFICELTSFDRKLSALSFSGHGCIYLKKHLEEKGVRSLELGLTFHEVDTDDDPPITRRDVNFDAAELFALGPVVDSGLWMPERNNVELDHGPWRSPLEFKTSLGMNELQWAKTSAKPHIDGLYGNLEPKSPIGYIQLLEKYLALASSLCPRICTRPTLSHIGLSSSNVFVDPDTRKITCVTNWQGTEVKPVLYQQSLPLLLRESLGSESGTGHFAIEVYMREMEARFPQRLEELTTPKDREGLLELVNIIPGAWTYKKDQLLFAMLRNLVGHWEGLIQMRKMEDNGEANRSTQDMTPPCPVAFETDEIENNEAYMRRFRQLMEVLEAHGLPPPDMDGPILARDLAETQKANETAKRAFIESADDEKEKRLFGKIWPYPVTHVVSQPAKIQDDKKGTRWKFW